MILIADDAPMFRELGSVFLARTGRVVTANNGFETLDVMRRERPRVVVADLDMPCMAGDELCRRIKSDADFRDIPVILVSGTGLSEDRARAVKAGANDVIVKPISRVALIQAVNRFLRGPARGLARIPFEAEVKLSHAGAALRGTARNLSRGGIFVEASQSIPPRTEVALEFELPDESGPLSSTAQVIWSRPQLNGRQAGMGLQFLAVDRTSVDRIDAFVYERAPLPALAWGAR